MTPADRVDARVEPTADPIRILLSTYLFQDLSPAELEPLTRRLQSRSYRRGEYVFHSGDPAEHLHIVAAGQIRYSIITGDGDQWVLEVLTSGAVFGEPGLFAPERTRIVDAVAMQVSSVLSIGRACVVDFLHDHPPAMMRMLEALAADARLRTMAATEIGFMTILDRIVRKLIELSFTDGMEDDGRVQIALSVTQGTLAGLVGATRENVNRALSVLAADGTVRVENRRLLITDLAALRRRSERGWAPLYNRNQLATKLFR